jgi:hypothetical protein
MNPPLRFFKDPHIVQNHKDGSIDVEFYDILPKGIRRRWWISNSDPEGEGVVGWYGTLSRSETDDSAFDFHSHELPKQFAASLGTIVQHNMENK